MIDKLFSVIAVFTFYLCHSLPRQDMSRDIEKPRDISGGSPSSIEKIDRRKKHINVGNGHPYGDDILYPNKNKDEHIKDLDHPSHENIDQAVVNKKLIDLLPPGSNSDIINAPGNEKLPEKDNIQIDVPGQREVDAKINAVIEVNDPIETEIEIPKLSDAEIPKLIEAEIPQEIEKINKEIESMDEHKFSMPGYMPFLGLSKILNVFGRRNIISQPHMEGGVLTIEDGNDPVVRVMVQSRIIGDKKHEIIEKKNIPKVLHKSSFGFTLKDFSYYDPKPKCPRIRAEINFLNLYRQLYPEKWNSEIDCLYNKLQAMSNQCGMPIESTIAITTMGLLVFLAMICLLKVIHRAVRAHRASNYHTYLQIGMPEDDLPSKH